MSDGDGYSDHWQRAETRHLLDTIDKALGSLLLVDVVAGEAALAQLRARLAAAEAEVARLTAALREAEERAAGPFLAACAARERSEYGLRLEAVLDALLQDLAEDLEQDYGPDEWAAVVAGWDVAVEHGVHLSPCLGDDGGPAAYVGSRRGVWWYDLRLTVTDSWPVLTAERRAGGAR